MIKRVSIENFYSYENADIHFSNGINVICGNSRSGKTTIRRAIEWVLKNRPQGYSLVSYWNRDSKNNLKGNTSVKVEVDNSSAKRLRNKEFNGYFLQRGDIIDTYEAIGTTVPEQVTDAFNFSDINLQKQFDSPFMLSESASEVARFFNKTIRLDVIDKVLGLAESKRRKNKQLLESLSGEKESLEKSLESYLFLDEAGTLLSEAEIVSDNLKKKQEEVEQLKLILRQINYAEQELSVYPSNKAIREAEEIIKQLIDTNASIVEKVKQRESLATLIFDLIKHSSVFSDLEEINVEEVECLMNKIQSLQTRLENTKKSVSVLEKLLSDIFENQSLQKTATEELAGLLSTVPKACQDCPLF